MQSVLLARTVSDKHNLRRSLRGGAVSCRTGEAGECTQFVIAWLPVGESMGRRLVRRAWRRVEKLVREHGIRFALAPEADPRPLVSGLLRLGVTLLDVEGVRQYLTAAAVKKWFALLGRETVSEMSACVQDAGSKWGLLWILFLSGWVRCLSATGPSRSLERLQREMLAHDGTVLEIGGYGRPDIRILLDTAAGYGDEWMIIDVKPIHRGLIPKAIACGWPSVPMPVRAERLTGWESLFAGVFHAVGHRIFTACTPLRGIGAQPDIGGAFHEAGVEIKGLFTGDSVMTFDRMRVQYLEVWSKTLADRKKRRLDNCVNHDL